MFKNASIYRLPADFQMPEEFDAMLAEHPLRSPGPLELETRGFLSLFPTSDDMTYTSQGAHLLTLGTDSRMLPASVLRDAVDARIAEHEATTGRKPGKRLRNDFREAALGELLPRAFIKRVRVGAYIDESAGLLIADSASDRVAESVCSAIREAFGSFPARPLACEASLNLLMSEWVRSGQLPEGFEIGDECEMKDPSDSTSVARFRHHDLSADEVIEHVNCGKQVTQLGLIFDGRIGFVLDARLKLRKLSFLDVVADQLDSESASVNDLIAAEFALMSLELRRLFARLGEVVGFVA
jgi:recombination associated protein RdgC